MGGPVHTRETSQLNDYIYAALTSYMHVPERGAPPSDPPPPPSGGGGEGGSGGGGGGTASLAPDQSLYGDQSVLSPDGRFRLTYQTDGNLVLYRWDDVPLWASGTWGTNPGQAVMQSDGNLVVYQSSGRPIWASGTAGFAGAYVSVQNDGNLVIYGSSGAPLWASGTSGY